MKIYYVDAENIGLSALEELTISVLDRVFVFTNSEHLKSACTNALVTCVSGYPNGQNQVMVWGNLNAGWQITRVLSYGHRPNQ